MKKTDIRKIILKKRNSLSEMQLEEENEYALSLIEEFFDEYISKYKKESLNICAFFPLEREINICKFYQKILDNKYDININLLFPRVENRNMNFYRISSFEDLEKGSYNIMEPKKNNKLFEYIKNSLVLVPCVGIHKKNFRLGYGAGFYDRYFKDNKNNYFVGLTHSFSKSLEFEYEIHDIKMQYII